MPSPPRRNRRAAGGGSSQGEAEQHNPPLLYHLGHDPAEAYNVAEEHAEVITAMETLRETHLNGIVPGKPQLTDGDFRGRWDEQNRAGSRPGSAEEE